jgi:hypothetical protein
VYFCASAVLQYEILEPTPTANPNSRRIVGEKNHSQAFFENAILTVRSKQLLFRLNIQVTPYVFNAFVFQNLGT